MIRTKGLLDRFSYEIPEDMAEQYARDLHPLLMERLNLAYAFAIILIPIAFVFDLLIFPSQAPVLLKVRLASMIICLALFFLSSKTGLKNYPSVMGHVLNIAVSASIVVLVSLTGQYASAYYAGLILTYIFFATLVPWGMGSCLLAGLTILVLHISYNFLPPLLMGHVIFWPVFWNSIYFLTFSFIMVIVAAFIMENARRQGYVSAQNERRAKDRIDDLMKQKSYFISNITHELKTPLSIIVGHSELLMEKMATDDPAYLAPLQQIQHSAFQLGNHVDRIIKVSQINEPDQELRLHNYNYVGIVRNIFTIFQAKAQEENKRYLLHAPETPVVIHGDAVVLEEIIINLIQNAFKFTTSGDTISVEIYADETNVYTEVTDTGAGIPQDKIEHIFERMYQADDVLSKQHSGIGLGLHICKNNIETHGGSITVSSQPNQGSTFRVALPLHPNQDAAVKNAAYTGLERRMTERRTDQLRRMEERHKRYEYRENLLLDAAANISSVVDIMAHENQQPDRPGILIVEDNDAMLRVLIEGLEDNYNIFLAQSGIEALEKLEAHKHEILLIISDVMMPGMSGFELCKLVMKQAQYKHIPFIFVSALISEEKQLEGYNLGATDYIVKPFNMKILSEKVAHWISRRTYEILLKEVSDSLQSKMRTVTKLREMILHEIRNPLHMIKGTEYFLEKLRNDFYESSTEQQKRWWSNVDKINRGVDCLTSVLETSRELAANSLGDRTLERVGDLVNEASAQAAHLFDENLLLCVETNPNVAALQISCNRQMLIQVLVNLIRNGTEAIAERADNTAGGLIRIRFERRDPYQVEIKIVDNGEGIPPEKHKNIFKFKYTSKINGAGVGLYFSRIIMTLHGGEIQVTSQLGEGSTFALVLPLAETEAAHPAPEASGEDFSPLAYADPALSADRTIPEATEKGF